MNAWLLFRYELRFSEEWLWIKSLLPDNELLEMVEFFLLSNVSSAFLSVWSELQHQKLFKILCIVDNF